MFGLEYLLAFIKICFNVAFAIVSAIPMYFAWNCIAPGVFISIHPKGLFGNSILAYRRDLFGLHFYR